MRRGFSSVLLNEAVLNEGADVRELLDSVFAAGLPSEAVSLASASVVRKVALEPCPPGFMASVTAATINLGSSKYCSFSASEVPEDVPGELFSGVETVDG